jgi:hypothetical protein
MKHAIDDITKSSTTNVIEVRFDRRVEKISQPEANNEQILLDDDPLEELLSELDECLFEDEEVQEDYIFHHQEKWDYNITQKDSLRSMSDSVLKQTNRLKEDVKRLKYYLDEMNLEP